MELKENAVLFRIKGKPTSPAKVWQILESRYRKSIGARESVGVEKSV